jgi:2',3'-cyclic-nucleotide 2'-phosphodiesterase/3'-nucleotidase
VRRALAVAASAALLAVGPVAGAERVAVTILQTTDLHGHLLPWDYQRAQPADEGLARVASRIAAIRRETPNVLLLDAGDTIQGTPIEFLHAKNPSKGPDPMAEAMSALRYDAMSVGNHEFNFGLAVLRKAQKESSFPWLSSNTRNVSDGSAAFPEYLVKTVAGIRIGILGLTTPNIPNWEPARNRPGLRWEDPVDAAKRLVPVLRGKEKCDFVVALIHSGPAGSSGLH